MEDALPPQSTQATEVAQADAAPQEVNASPDVGMPAGAKVSQASDYQQPHNTAPVLPDGQVHVYDMRGPKPILGSMDDTEVTQQVATGQFGFPQGMSIPVVSPDGQAGTVDANEAPQAFQNGYRYQTQAERDQAQYGDSKHAIVAGLEGAAQGAFGPVATATEIGLGRDPIEMAKTAEQNPWSHGIGEAVGFLGPAAAAGTASVLGNLGVSGAADVAKAINAGSAYTQVGVASKAVEDAARIMGMGSEAATLSGRLAQAGVKSGAEMALFQAGDEVTKALQQDPKQNAQTVVANIGLASVLGGGIGVGLQGVGELWKSTVGNKLGAELSSIRDQASGLPDSNPSVNPVAAGIITNLTNVPKGFVEDYAANRAAIKSLPADETIQDAALEHVQNIFDNVDNTKGAAENAQAALKDLENNNKIEFQQKGYDSRDASKAAKDSLKQAMTDFHDSNLNDLMDAGSKVTNSVEALRQQGFKATDAADDILGASDKKISLDPLKEKISDMAGELRQGGTGQANALADRLTNEFESISKAAPNGEVNGQQARLIIKALRRQSNFSHNAAEFDKTIAPYYNQMQHALDKTLKDAVPEYAEAMKPAADIFSKLGDYKAYGTEEGAQRALAALKSPLKYKQEIEGLKDLATRTGGDYVPAIENYANPEVRAARIKAMPEYVEHENAAAVERALKSPEYKQKLMEEHLNSPEYQKAMAAEAKYQEALSKKAELSGVTPNNIGMKIKKGMAGSSEDINRMFAKFPDLAERGMPEALRQAGIRAGLDKAVGNGSRNVNHIGMIGGAVGSLLGHIPGGAAVGAFLGGAIDKYGPRAAKTMIDMILSGSDGISKLMGKGARAFGKAGEADLAPDTLRSAVARFLDSDAQLTVGGNLQPTSDPSPEGFKAMHDFIDNLVQGNDIIQKSTSKLFKPGDESVLPKSMQVSQADRNKLEKHLEQYIQTSQDPNQLGESMNVATQLGRYMPDHMAAHSEMVSNVSEYLKAQRPSPKQLGPLDPIIPITQMDKTQWNRTLNIAQQPLTVIDNIKLGTITPKDVQDMKSMYPDLYNKLSQELLNSVVAQSSSGTIVPYKTRMGLSLFLGHPLDSTLTPASIIGAQPQPQQSPSPTDSGQAPKRSTAKLDKGPQNAMTPLQRRQSDRQKPQ